MKTRKIWTKYKGADLIMSIKSIKLKLIVLTATTLNNMTKNLIDEQNKFII